MRVLSLLPSFLSSMMAYGFLIPFDHSAGVRPVALCGNCREAIVVGNVLKCRLFGNQDVITGDVFYAVCGVAREDVEKCGPDGRFYVSSYTPVNSTGPPQ